MKPLEKIPKGKCNSVCIKQVQSVPVNPEAENSISGKSVEYAPHSEVRHWFPIRATYHRAQKVYNGLLAFGNNNIDPYLPTLCRVEFSDGIAKEPIVKEEPLDKGLLFVRSTLKDFKTLLETPPMIPGLTPYYNHFQTDRFGKNEFLTVPDRQMESFKIIVESRNQDIIVRQNEIPKIIEGDNVIVTDGPFAGVEGIVMKYKHQKRVFVQLHGVGIYATAYVPGAWIRLKLGVRS